jgi:hypothetical protein
MTNTFVLFKKLLATLMLVGMMTAFVTGCSSSGDSDDSASDSSSGGSEQELQQCNDLPIEDQAQCEIENEKLRL